MIYLSDTTPRLYGINFEEDESLHTYCLKGFWPCDACSGKMDFASPYLRVLRDTDAVKGKALQSSIVAIPKRHGVIHKHCLRIAASSGGNACPHCVSEIPRLQTTLKVKAMAMALFLMSGLTAIAIFSVRAMRAS